MSYADPNTSLGLQPRSTDVFDANYHPDLDALIELRFQAFKKSGLESKIREPKTHTDANAGLGKILLGLFVGIPTLSFIMFKFVMAVST